MSTQRSAASPRAAADAAAGSAPPPVTLVIGPEEFLAERAVSTVVRAARGLDPEVNVHDLGPGELGVGMLAELTSPSLFGGGSVVVIRGGQDLATPVIEDLGRYVSEPADGAWLVLLHKGGTKGKALLDAVRAAKVPEVDCSELRKYADKVAFVRNEVRTAGGQIGDGAARAVLDAVGGDLRELASACEQLVADTGGAVDERAVRQYYAGRAEVTSFMVADHAVEGRLGEALANLRWALGSGVDPVLVTAALAMGLRNLARLGSAPRDLRPADLARELALPSWKLDRLRQQLRGWSPDGVAYALAAVAEADAAVKGGGTSAEYALEKAILTITEARSPSARSLRRA
ncbi:MAG: DNA polymerase III subunit delta [Sporichthyaceae bacterium]|nr:DNA polymerase III subunit delta [Sporichthyaceae bacterium]